MRRSAAQQRLRFTGKKPVDLTRIPSGLALITEAGDVRWGWNAPSAGVPTQFHDLLDYSTDGGVTWTPDTVNDTLTAASFLSGAMAGKAYSNARTSPTTGRMYRARVSAIYSGVEYTFAVSNTVTY